MNDQSKSREPLRQNRPQSKPIDAERAGQARSMHKPRPGIISNTFSSLSLPNYRTLWMGMFFSQASMQMNMVSRSWLAYHLSGSALILGVVAITRGFPQLILSPIGGVVADRVDKRKMLLFLQSGMGALSLINAILVHMGIIQIWHLVTIGVFQGILFPFLMTTRQAYVAEIVGTRHLSNAIALDSTGRNFNRIIAPSVAGMLIAWNPTLAFYAIALLYVGSVFTIIRLPSSQIYSEQKSYLQELLSGFRYITSERMLLVLIAMVFFTVVFGMPFQQLLPVFQIKVLHVGPARLGFMYGSVGIGAFIGSLGVAYFSGDSRKELFQLAACIGFGISLVLFSISKIYWFSLICLAFIGMFSQSYLTLNRTMVLTNTDKSLYGRVMGIYAMNMALMPIAVFPMGAIVDVIGAPVTVGCGGILMMIFVTLLYLIQFRRQR